MTCEDCLHYESCKEWVDMIVSEGIQCRFEASGCRSFTDKSEWVHLPCKVGDTVYELFCGEICEATIDRISINRFTVPQIWIEVKLDFATAQNFRIDTVNNNGIYFTRKEAEKALAQRTVKKNEHIKIL